MDNFASDLAYRFVTRVHDWVPEQWHDQIHKRGLPETAMDVADRWAESQDPEGDFGSSDFNAAMADFLQCLGFRVEIVNSRYTVTGILEG